MPRKPRLDFPGAWHHVMHRGARRGPIFKKDSHCNLFLDLVENAVRDFEIEVHAYSLMPNHYRLVNGLRAPRRNRPRSQRTFGYYARPYAPRTSTCFIHKGRS